MQEKIPIKKSDPISELIDEIVKIPGSKIVTLTTSEGDLFEVEVNEKGIVGYQTEIKEFFMARLIKALDIGGGVVIRQFLPLKVKRRLRSGSQEWVPEKNLYGVVLKDNRWLGISPEQLQDCCNRDARTGLPIPPEEGIHYKSFPI